MGVSGWSLESPMWGGVIGVVFGAEFVDSVLFFCIFKALPSCWRSSTAEQLICNQQVGGSSPSASSDRFSTCVISGQSSWLASALGQVAKRSNATDCKSVGLRPSEVRILPCPQWPTSLF